MVIFVRTSNAASKYEYVVHLMRAAEGKYAATLDRLFSEDKKNTRSFKVILRQKCDNTLERIDDLWAFRKNIRYIRKGSFRAV